MSVEFTKSEDGSLQRVTTEQVVKTDTFTLKSLLAAQESITKDKNDLINLFNENIAKKNVELAEVNALIEEAKKLDIVVVPLEGAI